MPYAFGAVYFIFCVVSIASPPEEGVVDVTLVVNDEGDTPFGFSMTPEKTNDLTPLLAGPEVVRYYTSINYPLVNFLPKTPSPINISYL